jgi:uncharacterized membrane protein YbhN (UPF0104 family)
MSKTMVKRVLAPVIVIATIGAFAYYINANPESVRQLARLPLSTVGILLGLYGLFLVMLTWIQRATLSLCGVKLHRRESILLVAYSSIINFFGPLQSGPAFRAAYLKSRHGVKLKNYTLATLLYYGFYALFSGLFILTYFMGFWALVGIGLIVLLAPLLLRKKSLLPKGFKQLELSHVSNLAAATLAQVSVIAVIFFIELNSLGRAVGAIPSLIYTGAANFALFVSFTPGAIGFRESFLVFSQGLHEITSDTIVAASLIDRGIYILFLGLLAALVFGLHAERLLKSQAGKLNSGKLTDKTSK